MASTNNNINNSTDNDLYVNSLTNDGASETFDLRKSRAGGVITSGDVLGAIFFSGFDGTNFIPGAKITSTSSGTIATGRVAANLVFLTHPDSATVATQRMAIASTGAITISTPDSGTALTVSGGGLTVTGTTTLNTPLGVASGGTNASSMATTNGIVYYDGTRLVTTAVGTAAQVLTSNGVGVAPTFQAAGGGGVTSLAGTTNQITASASTGAVTLSIPSTFIAPGSIAATTTVTATSGAITSTNGDHVVGNTAAATTAPFVTFKKSRTAGVITSGDVLGEIDFTGIGTSTTYVTGASITSTSSGTIASNRVAANLVFSTHPDSASGLTPTTRMTIASTGAITIATPDSGTALTISGGGETITAGDLTISSGNILLPTTSSTVGQIKINSTRWLHAYGTSNIWMGNNAGSFTTTGTQCIGIGENTLSNASATGVGNVAVGYQSGQNLVAGAFNTLVGYQAGKFASNGNCNNNVVVGYNALNQSQSNSTDNVFIGYNAGAALTNRPFESVVIGSQALAAATATNSNSNILIGFKAGFSFTAGESSNVIIGYTTGTAGDNNVLRIGNGTGTGSGQQNQCFISGITGATVTGTTVLCSTGNQLGTIASARRFKEDIDDMGNDSEFIYKLRPVSFNYKNDPDKIRQQGLIAEEVADISTNMVAYDKDGQLITVQYHLLPALLLNELQKMSTRMQALTSRIDFLEKEILGRNP